MLRRVSLTDSKIKVSVPKHVQDKIRYLNSQIVKDEWSGVLFYSTEGSIKDPANMQITLQDVFPMNKGNGTYTEYIHDETIVEYMMEHPESIRWQRGQIHSHNVMDVFFSSTDMSELNDNLGFYNYYLSIIVNNYGDITGKVAFQSSVQVPTYTAKDENGTEYNFGVDLKEEPIMFYYECDITTPTYELNISDEFKQRVGYIIKKETMQAKVANKYKPKTTYGYGQPQTTQPVVTQEQMSEEMDDLIALDSFLIFWLSMGKVVPMGTIMEEVISEIDSVLGRSMEESDVVKYLIDTFESGYDDYFGNEVHDRDYMTDLLLMITLLDDYSKEYKFVSKLVDNIKETVDQIEAESNEETADELQKEKQLIGEGGEWE